MFYVSGRSWEVLGGSGKLNYKHFTCRGGRGVLNYTCFACLGDSGSGLGGTDSEGLKIMGGSAKERPSRARGRGRGERLDLSCFTRV